MKKYFIVILLVVSLSLNAVMYLDLSSAEKPSDSIIKLSFDEHNLDVYCEKTSDIDAVEVDLVSNEFVIGKAKLKNESDGVYLVNGEVKHNLSGNGEDACVINSEGDVIYKLVKPLVQEMVFATPHGRKYHKDKYCAGKTAFEVPLETARLFREPCNLCM